MNKIDLSEGIQDIKSFISSIEPSYYISIFNNLLDCIALLKYLFVSDGDLYKELKYLFGQYHVDDERFVNKSDEDDFLSRFGDDPFDLKQYADCFPEYSGVHYTFLQDLVSNLQKVKKGFLESKGENHKCYEAVKEFFSIYHVRSDTHSREERN